MASRLIQSGMKSDDNGTDQSPLPPLPGEIPQKPSQSPPSTTIFKNWTSRDWKYFGFALAAAATTVVMSITDMFDLTDAFAPTNTISVLVLALIVFLIGREVSNKQERLMNKKQRISIAVGIGLVAVSCLFPSYEGIFQPGSGIERGNRVFVGYYPLFFPPSSVKVAERFYPARNYPTPIEKDQNCPLSKLPDLPPELLENSTDWLPKPLSPRQKHIQRQEELNQMFFAYISVHRVLLQFLAIVIVTVGLVILFADKKREPDTQV